MEREKRKSTRKLGRKKRQKKGSFAITKGRETRENDGAQKSARKTLLARLRHKAMKRGGENYLV